MTRHPLNPHPGHFTASGIILIISRLPPCKLLATMSTLSSSPSGTQSAKNVIPPSCFISSRGDRLSEMREEGENPPETRWQGRCATRLVWPTLTLQVRLSRQTRDAFQRTNARAVVARRTSMSCALEWLVVPRACACRCWSPPFSPPHQTRSGMALASSAHFCFHNAGVKALEARRDASGSALQNNTLAQALQIQRVAQSQVLSFALVFVFCFFTQKPSLFSYSTLDAKLYYRQNTNNCVHATDPVTYTRKKQLIAVPLLSC